MTYLLRVVSRRHCKIAAIQFSSLQVRSQLTLSSVSPTWAVQNRAALTATLRNTLQLQPEEVLVINSVVAARQLSATTRKLQSGGVKIEFTLGFSQTDRASVSESRLRQLASGSTSAIISHFVQQLDVELQARGQPPIALTTKNLTFTNPQRVVSTTLSQGGPAGNQQSAGASWEVLYNNKEPGTAKPASSDHSLMIFVAVFLILVAAVSYQRGKGARNGVGRPPAPDVYASKIAQLPQLGEELGPMEDVDS